MRTTTSAMRQCSQGAVKRVGRPPHQTVGRDLALVPVLKACLNLIKIVELQGELARAHRRALIRQTDPPIPEGLVSFSLNFVSL